MTELERLQTAKAAIAQAPGGELWLEELLIRGRPDGTISGGHAIYAWRAADAFGGKTPPQMMAPFPLTIGVGEQALAEVLADMNAAAVDTLAEQALTIEALTAERDSLLAQLAEQ